MLGSQSATGRISRTSPLPGSAETLEIYDTLDEDFRRDFESMVELLDKIIMESIALISTHRREDGTIEADEIERHLRAVCRRSSATSSTAPPTSSTTATPRHWNGPSTWPIAYSPPKHKNCAYSDLEGQRSMDELLSEFLTETAEHLEGVETQLVQFERNPTDASLVSSIFRLVHTIKGTSSFLGLTRLPTRCPFSGNADRRFARWHAAE